ncbi:hypothetical protein KMI5_22 [Klebsiella phage KMI5]|uniref:Uncharacterized protein n=1 Tax=Klebsiella phage KMI3 TaxID=2601614 RepID=A0A5B9NBZ9_9CAUD|nr:hypothetical protein KMI3_15 [Klebsiella phage KMI3]QEG10081.1 hypothetical protein KMI5_22 [Klebsiella phage KMI5]
MEMKARYERIYVPIYCSEVFVTNDTATCTALAKQHCKVEVDPESYLANGLVVCSSDTQVVWLPKQASARTVAHECAHAVLNLCHYKDIIIDTSNQEPFTYLMGYMFYEINKAREALDNDHQHNTH